MPRSSWKSLMTIKGNSVAVKCNTGKILLSVALKPSLLLCLSALAIKQLASRGSSRHYNLAQRGELILEVVISVIF